MVRDLSHNKLFDYFWGFPQIKYLFVKNPEKYKNFVHVLYDQICFIENISFISN